MILAYNSSELIAQPGILGVTKGFYGCVEAQGCGTLHCHMLVWIEGALNPQQIKYQIIQDKDQPLCDHILNFINDTIMNEIPAPPANHDHIPCTAKDHHACSVHCSSLTHTKEQLQMDFHCLVSKCQIHRHTQTCWKFVKH